MRLHSPAFEKTLRKEIKRQVRADRELRREAKRSRKRVANPWLGRVFRVLVSFILAVLVWRTIEVTHHVDAGLMIINLWMISLTCGFASNLLHLPFRSTDIAALRLLPAEESLIFQWELSKFFTSTIFCLTDLTAGFGALGWALHLSYLQWSLTLVLILLTGAFMVALATLGAARFPQLPYALVYGSSYLFWFAVLVTSKHSANWTFPFIDKSAPDFNWWIPIGWPLSMFHCVLFDGNWTLAPLVILIGGVLWSFKSSLDLISARFAYIEPLMAEASDLVPGEENLDKTAAATNANQRSIGPTAIGEGILSGQFLLQEEWNRGWLERKLWQWLSQREKNLAEFAFSHGFSITKPWQKILRNFLIVTLLGFGLGWISVSLQLWAFVVGFVFVCFQALAQITATGAAFGAIMIGGLHIPIYAAYPITFRDLSRTLLKCSAIQMPFFVLLVTASLIVLSHFTGMTFVLDFLIAINAGIVLWGARFFLMVFSFSSGTNDSSTFSLRSVALFVLFSFFGLGFLILAVFTGVFVMTSAASEMCWFIQPVMWIGCLLALLDGYVFFRIYGWLYSANRFDLIRMKP